MEVDLRTDPWTLIMAASTNFFPQRKINSHLYISANIEQYVHIEALVLYINASVTHKMLHLTTGNDTISNTQRTNK